MASQKTDVERLRALSNRYVSESKLQMSRNLCYGAAGFSFLVVFLIVESGIESSAVDLSLRSAVFSMPIWFLIGSLYEQLVLIGKASHSYLRTQSWERNLAVLGLSAGLGTYVSICALFWHLGRWLLPIFLAASGFALYHHFRMERELAHFVFKERKELDADDT